ncbi:tRNA uridine 5-carbamoylmethylation protein Kti12 [Catenibacillus scindens]|uniref:tRNA uridine 5-carbamoylmethylation protein Kti12 n=1 Tax=Catenibacillus scindens TaxID=673271 RepID=A0A7W8HCX8_9FIRM|nr:hypothetical protein [Catenibacillus scindens]MBB5265377.1 tRNA uridine 5-carbamoylmethylation protein Kti12 [Catenibacillus scindens]
MLVLNFFGGPGVGKSTYSAYFYSMLKMRGINCELVTEYAKQKVWEGNDTILSNQVYLFSKQYVGLTKLDGKVELAIMDSPLLLSLLYQSNIKIKDSFYKMALDCHSEFDNINYLICGNGNYTNQGRYQSCEEAIKLSSVMKKILDYNEVQYRIIQQYTGLDGIDKLNEQIEEIYTLILNKRK